MHRSGSTSPNTIDHGMLAITCISSQRRSAPSGATPRCLLVYDSPFSLMFSLITSMGTHSNAGSWYIVPEGGELALVFLVQIHMGYHDDANNASR